MFETQNQGVPGNHYNLVDSTITEQYIPTILYHVSQSALLNQYCLVVVVVAPWNHFLSDSFYRRFPKGSSHQIIYRIHSPPKPDQWPTMCPVHTYYID